MKGASTHPSLGKQLKHAKNLNEAGSTEKPKNLQTLKGLGTSKLLFATVMNEMEIASSAASLSTAGSLPPPSL